MAIRLDHWRSFLPLLDEGSLPGTTRALSLTKPTLGSGAGVNQGYTGPIRSACAFRRGTSHRTLKFDVAPRESLRLQNIEPDQRATVVSCRFLRAS
jgi:hypothetical protein